MNNSMLMFPFLALVLFRWQNSPSLFGTVEASSRSRVGPQTDTRGKHEPEPGLGGDWTQLRSVWFPPPDSALNQHQNNPYNCWVGVPAKLNQAHLQDNMKYVLRYVLDGGLLPTELQRFSHHQQLPNSWLTHHTHTHTCVYLCVYKYITYTVKCVLGSMRPSARRGNITTYSRRTQTFFISDFSFSSIKFVHHKRNNVVNISVSFFIKLFSLIYQVIIIYLIDWSYKTQQHRGRGSGPQGEEERRREGFRWTAPLNVVRDNNYSSKTSSVVLPPDEWTLLHEKKWSE